MALRVAPDRGPVAAAGAVLLTVAIFLTLSRMDASWANGVQFVILLAAATALLLPAWFTPVDDRPPTWLSTLLVTGLILDLAMLLQLAELLGAEDNFSSGTLTWVMAIFALESAYFAITKNSAVCMLFAAIAVGIEAVAFVDWVFEPETAQTFRWILLVLTLLFAGAAAATRDTRPRYATHFVNAAGLAALGLAGTIIAGLVGTLIGSVPGVEGFSTGFGWELYLLLAGAGVVAYAVLEREPGPGYIGGLVLFAFAIVAESSDEPTLIGWPIVLVLAALALLALAFRPGAAAPPPTAVPPGAPAVGEDRVDVRVDE